MPLTNPSRTTCSGLDKGNLGLLLQVPAAESNTDGELALRNDPLLGNDIPVAEITAHQLKADTLALASLEEDLLESTELLGGSTLGGALGEADVELRNGGAVDLAAVGNGNGNVVDALPEGGVTTGLDGEGLGHGGDVVSERLSGDVGDLKGGVRQTETELVADRHVLGVKVAVVNLELLVEPRLPVVGAGGVDGSGGRGVVVGTVQGNGVGKTTGGVDITVEEVDEGVARLLTGVVGGEDGGNVGVVGPGESVDTGGDNLVTIPVDAEVSTISTLGSPGLEEDKADIRKSRDPEVSDVGSGDECVVHPLLNKSSVLLSAGVDGSKGRDEVSETTSSGTTTNDKVTKLKVLLVVETLGDITSIVTKDGNGLGLLEGKGVVLVLEEDSRLGAVLADQGTVVTADVTAAGTGKVELLEPGLSGGESVEVGAGLVDRGVVLLVLAEPEVRSHDAHNHVVDTSLLEGAVGDGAGQVTAKERTSLEVHTVGANATGHVHVETALDGSNTGVGATPIRHDITLETELVAQDSVEELGVLTAVRAVETLVGAHEAGSLGMGGVGKGPKVKLVHGSVVHVGGESLLVDLADVAILLEGGVSHNLLLVTDKVLGSGLDTGVLVTVDGVLHGDTGQVGVGREALPVAARVGRTSKRTGDGSEKDMGTLGLELLTQCETALVEKVLVPGRCGGNTSRKNTGVVGDSDSEGTVMETETLEAETRNGDNVSNTGTGSTSDHVGLFLEGQLGEELLGFGEALFPSFAMRRVAILSKDGSVLGLNPAEGLLVASTTTKVLGAHTGGQQARDQHGPKASHCGRGEESWNGAL
ncbi:hypothetical protein HG531_003730 [Fusarium graminearum]|nr:hypothetical protein HG531_003730 [Fusarium graminearum]